jgi:hypothetical protein
MSKEATFFPALDDRPTDLDRLRDGLLALLSARPHTYSEIAGPKRGAARGAYVPLIRQLKAASVIRTVYLHGTEYLTLTSWEPGPGYTQELIDERTKRTVDGCLIWQAYSDPKRGPVLRDKDNHPKSVRRTIWEKAYGPLAPSFSLRMVECDHPGCVELSHMWPRRRSDEAKGRPNSVAQNAKIAATKRKTAKLTDDDVRALRDGSMTPAQVAKARGVSLQAARAARAGECWKEYASPFAGLLQGAGK